MIHSTGRQSDSCKCSDNHLSWVTAILDQGFISWNRVGMLTEVVEGAAPLHEKENLCEYILCWIIVLSFLDAKEGSKKVSHCFHWWDPIFLDKIWSWGNHREGFNHYKWMVTVFLSSSCSWRWRAVFPSAMFPHSSFPVVLCKTSYYAMQKNHQCKS